MGLGRYIRYILTQGLKPGDRLPAERGLSESLGISRNVVREALRALEVGAFYVRRDRLESAGTRSMAASRRTRIA
jgi:DNA-binding FadR family transcriptional regulator